MKLGRVTFSDSSRLAVEIPETDAERQIGLSHRTILPPYAGMLFDFGREGLWVMTMYRTKLNLDMIFLNQDGVVVYLIEDCQAHASGGFGTPIAAKYVLEVNARWVYDHGIVLGTRAKIEVLG